MVQRYNGTMVQQSPAVGQSQLPQLAGGRPSKFDKKIRQVRAQESRKISDFENCPREQKISD